MKILNNRARRRLREKVVAPLLWTQFKIDTFPTSPYQPLPWLGLNSAARARACESRWEPMTELIDQIQPETAIDIGCSSGWFSIQLGRRGISTIGVEGNPRAARVFTYAARRLELTNLHLLQMHLSPSSVEMIPSADLVIFMSVWHHLPQYYGLEKSRRILEQVWDKAGRLMFFETGERELTLQDGFMKFEPDSKTWVTDLLTSTCPGGEVIHLGTHGAEVETVERNLFAVVRR